MHLVSAQQRAWCCGCNREFIILQELDESFVEAIGPYKQYYHPRDDVNMIDENDGSNQKEPRRDTNTGNRRKSRPTGRTEASP